MNAFAFYNEVERQRSSNGSFRGFLQGYLLPRIRQGEGKPEQHSQTGSAYSPVLLGEEGPSLLEVLSQFEKVRLEEGDILNP